MNASPRYTISPLFGEIAIRLGLADPGEVMDALCVQSERRTQGLPCERIGQILVDRGVFTPADVKRVMEHIDERTRELVLPGFLSLTRVGEDRTTLKFRGKACGTHETVLLRILRFGLAEEMEDAGRFLDECELLSRLSHPNIVRVLGTGEVEGIPYLVVEYVSGESLRARLFDGGALPEPRALDILVSVASALRYSHSLGIPHGSLMPAAILLPRVGPVRLTDFALFDWCSRAGSPGAARMDSPYYLPPEHAERFTRATVSSDIYALGATFFHMLTGRPPFCGLYFEVLEKHLRLAPPDPRSVAPGITSSAAELALDMLAKDPEDRPRSMEEVIRRASPLLRAAPVSEEEPALPARLKSRKSSR